MSPNVSAATLHFLPRLSFDVDENEAKIRLLFREVKLLDRHKGLLKVPDQNSRIGTLLSQFQGCFDVRMRLLIRFRVTYGSGE